MVFMSATYTGVNEIANGEWDNGLLSKFESESSEVVK
jgi:hypothetical protein